MNIFKDRRWYWFVFLSVIFFAQIALFFVLQFYTLPQYKQQLNKLSKQVENLQKQKTQRYDDAGVSQTLDDYMLQTERAKILQSARNNVFSPKEEGGFDFTPDLLDTIFPVITAHLHNDIMVESISINEKAEVVIPVLADSYTILSKQFLAFKEVFDKETTPLLTDIKVNTFTRQEMEILERDENRNFVKQRKKVSKATIIAKINPLFFEKTGQGNEEDFSVEGMFSPHTQKTSIMQKIKNIIQNIIQNIQKDKVITHANSILQ